MRSALLVISVFLSSTASASVLRVDRATGQVTWDNTSGFTIPFFGYWITSESGSVNPDAWVSIAEYGDADSGGSLDPDDEWLVFHRRPTLVSESSFTGTAYLSTGQAIDFGAGLWRIGGEEDLEMIYLDDIVFAENPVPVDYFGTAPQFPPGDYNASGLVEQADLDLVLGSWGSTASMPPANWTNDLPTGNIDQNELDAVLANWGASAASVAASGTSAAVPEPKTAVLLIVGAMTVAALYSRRQKLRAANPASLAG